MSKVIYNTLEECQKAIATVAALGMEAPDWMIRQLKELEAKKQAKEVSLSSDTPIYDTLVAHYPYGEMPQEKKDCIESTVAQLLEDGPHADEPGLLLGKIQCGKTDTFEDIIGLAFDKGIDITIVFTKGTKPLAEQTLMRMKKDYRFFKSTDDLDQRATIHIHDIMNVWKGLKQVKVEGCKNVIVCKKQATNLSHLIDLFEKNSPFLKNKKVLIVDDEADFASRNYRSVKMQALLDEEGNPIAQDSENEMAKISQQIDDFRKIPAYCRYLQVTATPYCLYLQPQGELNLNGNVIKPFKPRFTTLVPIHSAYIGGKEYFEDSQDKDSMYSHLFHQVEQKCMDVLGHEDKRYLKNAVSSVNLYGLTYSLVSYFMGTAIRRIQVRNTESKHYMTSALIHVELDKKNHDWQKKVIERLIQDIKKAILEEDQSDLRIWSAIETNYNDFQESNEKGCRQGLISVELPSLDEILDEMRDIFNPNRPNYTVQVVNSDKDVPNLLDEESGELRLETAANIFIGGNILDRGITIKNMICFFYGRNPKNFQQDTVLQHARMYGARSKEDMAVTRLHTTPQIHKILVRMNELDNQLREWFLSGKDQSEPNAIFVGYDKNIRPCATQKIKVSNALTLKPQMRKLPIGFWTGSKTAIHKTVEQIDRLITESANYVKQDEDGIFEMTKEEVMHILNLIESTYLYDEKHNNLDRKNDIKEMLCALEYCAEYSQNKVYVMHRTNRNMSRLRSNGGFIDAPEDGRTDSTPANNKAIDAPVVIFLRENGNKELDPVTGENIGWNNAAFYWPVLRSQKNINPVMFALEQSKKKKKVMMDHSQFLNGYEDQEILKLTFQGDLLEAFGGEGKEYELGKAWETRALKETTAARYLQKDEAGEWKLSPDADKDNEGWHGVYSLNKGVFPFLLRNYKYLLLRNGRDAQSDLMLLELYPQEMWETIPEGTLDAEGLLRDRDTNQVLLNGTDHILSANMKKTKFIDKTITQWVIGYPIKKVVKFQQNAQDIDELFDAEE